MGAEEEVGPETLGRSTWTFLHTLAAAYPLRPSKEEQHRVQRFMKDFAQIYPCAPCAESFQEIIKQDPPDGRSGPAFAQWMCRVHNEVNKEIGKDLFDCSKVGEKWGVCEQCTAHRDKLDDFKQTFKGFQSVQKMNVPR
ncbi:FAD-linked sulfhydryl oxidase ERV1 [Gracilariopsis chorda]|uniref:Sulfhydryl oxidase n=1 Tax=Gracilariopsis chorda TaxID=448386 RepID=A0A2V3IM80_9FLOR|nr:FAD-linked sulfhydryl oxidase ERV1 [Gracilariopsis chorda]|eukprot:PXF43184.1 FAD-linked sulfhydryl oxidase ERV1 [Gracilariopsis chorda]